MITKLGRLLEEITGMAPSVLGDRILERALRERMSACKLADEKQYLERVLLSPEEMEALIDAVVVPETSFFRNSGPFAFLCGYIRSEWLPARNSEQLRVLSAPCSSGEEPYSVAMMLQEAGLEPGVDVEVAFSPERTDPGNRKYSTAPMVDRDTRYQ